MTINIPNLNISDIDIAWMAGLLEGEGSFQIDNRSKTRYIESTAPPSVYIKISMTDKDVIERFAKLVNKQNFQAGNPTKGGKTEYIVSVGKRETLLYLIPRLIPQLGERRTQQAQKCLDILNEWVIWVQSGGRSRSASKGGTATAKKKFRRGKLKLLEKFSTKYIKIYFENVL